MSVTVNAPVDFLTSPTTVYPVTVDPTVTVNEKQIITTPDGDIDVNAIEDLCIYTSSTNPLTNSIASLGNYNYSSGSIETSRMLYRLTSSYYNSSDIDYYLNDVRYYSASLFVPGYVSGNGVRVNTHQFLSDWTNGTSNRVEDELYYSHGTQSATRTVSNTSVQMIEFDVTEVLRIWATATQTVRNRGLALIVNEEGSSSDTSCSNRVYLYQTEQTSSTVYFSIDYSGWTDEYYINNTQSRHFLKTNTSANNLLASVYSASSNIKWQLEYAGDDSYYIVSSNNNLVLYAAGTTVKVGTKLNSNYYKWTLPYANSSSRYIRNVSNGYYMKWSSDSSITLVSSPDANCYFSMQTIASYKNLTSFSISDLHLAVGSSVTPPITKSPSNATYTSRSDFTWSSLNAAVVTVSSSGVVTATQNGGVTAITVKAYRTIKAVYGVMCSFG